MLEEGEFPDGGHDITETGKEVRDMEIVLLEDVKALGKKGTDRNGKRRLCQELHPAQKLGVEATSKNLNDLKL